MATVYYIQKHAKEQELNATIQLYNTDWIWHYTRPPVFPSHLKNERLSLVTAYMTRAALIFRGSRCKLAAVYATKKKYHYELTFHVFYFTTYTIACYRVVAGQFV
jgi:hypothetical protein